MKGKAVSQQPSALQNRLQKNLKKLKSYLSKNGIRAFRLYNKDIPEYPFLIDIYDDHAVVFEQGKKLEETDELREKHLQEIEQALTSVLEIPPPQQHFKVRTKQKGKEQYQIQNQSNDVWLEIAEPPFTFLVNLERYLDTGLFLDHRPLRQFLAKNSQKKTVLNLFCYTGSLSVAAAVGGGKVTSIDMSRTYLDWAMENFRLNEINPDLHRFVQADVLQELSELKEKKQKFDLILLDPPSFSNSKRMEDDLDVQRDHPLLIRDCMHLLSPQGTLYFSTNKRRFELHEIVSANYMVKEITHWTIPQDFHHSEIHRSFAISFKQPA